MVSKGDLVFLLDVDTTQYERGFDRAEHRLPSFERQMKRSLQRLPDLDQGLNRSGRNAGQAAGGYNKAGRAALELSRGIEDAAVVFSTTGIGGALRASSNNISQFASIIHPAAGAVTGLAVAAGSILIPKLFETDEKLEESKEKVRSLSDEVSQLRDNMEKGFSLQATVDSGSGSIEKSLSQLDRRDKFEKRQLDRLKSERQRLLREFGTEREGRPGEFEMRKEAANFIDQPLLEAAKKREFELRTAIEDIQGRRSDIQADRLTLSTNLTPTRMKETEQRHADMRARDIEQAREEERELKQIEERERQEAERTAERKRQEAERLAERQEQFRQGLTDDLDPARGRERTILNELRGRRREIDDLFGGDTSLVAQAEEAARQKLLGLEKPGKLPSGSPMAFEAGSSAAVGFINRSANEARPVETQQLAELKTITGRINKLIDSTRHSADLPPADIAGG